MITYKTLEQGREFYVLMGPFLVSRAVRRELGIAISSDEHYRWVLALDGDTVAGFAAVELYGDTAQLRHVYVVPEYRGRGVCSELVEAHEEIARKAGFASIEAVVAPTLRALLDKRGYEQVGNRGKYAIMEKSL